MNSRLKPFIRRHAPPFILRPWRLARKKEQDARVYLFRIMNKGGDFECNFCHKQFKKFLPRNLDRPVYVEKDVIGAGSRANVTCPSCKSYDRERLVGLFLERRVIFNKNLDILHIAPEKCLHGWILTRAHNKYVYGDLTPENVEYMDGIQELDVTNLPSADGEFDIVICNHVLEHVLDDVRAMREIYRVMKVGGIGILQVPISWKMRRSLENSAVVEPKERTRIFGQSDHVRIYGRDYLDRLKNAGFAVELIEKVCDDQQRFAVNPREKLFIVRK